DHVKTCLRKQGGELVYAVQAHALLKTPSLIAQFDLLDHKAAAFVDTARDEHIALTRALGEFERPSHMFRVEIVQDEMPAGRERPAAWRPGPHARSRTQAPGFKATTSRISATA